MLFLALLFAPTPAHAINPTGGVAAGVLVRTAENPYPTTPTLVPRFGLQFDARWSTEINFGLAQGTTTDGRYPFRMSDPRLDVLGSLTPDHKLDFFIRGGVGLQLVGETHPIWGEAGPTGETKVHLFETLIEAGPGLKWNVAGPLWLRTDLMIFPTFGDNDIGSRTDIYPNMEWTIGIDLRKPVDQDKDDDGIKDKADKCPTDPEDKDSFQDEDGCPDPDNDADGVADAADKCVNDPEDKDGFQDDDGCPDPDNDADGVPDASDQCADKAEDKDGFKDEDGCPDPDNDDDAIADAKDKCPNEPETRNGYQDRDGCPDEVPAEVKKFTGVIQGINFETNKAIIKPNSEPVLSAALKVLQQFPEVRLEVQGHTDNVGDDAKNMKLSQDRAQAVVDWFVAHGVDKSRLEAKGFGETTPIADNATKAGQAQNRRVEFKMLREAEAK